jgi:hypothetical protein
MRRERGRVELGEDVIEQQQRLEAARRADGSASIMRSAMAPCARWPPEPNCAGPRRRPRSACVSARSSRCGPASVTPRSRSRCATRSSRRRTRARTIALDRSARPAARRCSVISPRATADGGGTAPRTRRRAPPPMRAGRDDAAPALDQAVVPRLERRRRAPAAARCAGAARAVALQRVEVAAHVERQHDVEEAASLARRAGDDRDVGRREDDAADVADRVAEPLRLAPSTVTRLRRVRGSYAGVISSLTPVAHPRSGRARGTRRRRSGRAARPAAPRKERKISR